MATSKFKNFEVTTDIEQDIKKDIVDIVGDSLNALQEFRNYCTKQKVNPKIFSQIDLIEEEFKKNPQIIDCLKKVTSHGMGSVPVAFLRSALFSVVKRGPRKQFFLDNNARAPIIASWKGYEIRYTGSQLNQSDLDVLIACFQICQEEGLGRRVQISMYKVATTMGRRGGQKYYDWIEESIRRLENGNIYIATSDQRFEFSGSLIENFKRAGDGWELRLNHDLFKLFQDGYTAIDLETRRSLNSDLDKWVYGFFCSHNGSSYPIGIDKLRELSGSEREPKKFKSDFKSTMERLKNQTNIELTFSDPKHTLIKSKKNKLITAS
ncbi:plasmid replication initiator TrfA [Piscirickettsia salmonis]|uniref:plasmid replication initiator TrfA n=1 Tax=Piscirickettsia salmonis TaxID=1238 RepID=UPI003EBC30A6